MKRITDTWNGVLAICIAVFMLFGCAYLLVFSTAGMAKTGMAGVWAKAAEITAYTARTDSYEFVQEVASGVQTGLGIPESPVGQPVGESSSGTGETTTSQPEAVRSSQRSEQALLAWRGVDTTGNPLKKGVDLTDVQRQVTEALNSNSQDRLALWLQKRLNACGPSFNTLQKTLTAESADEIQTAATDLVNTCNPRILRAHAVYRWAALAKQPAGGDVSPELLSGLDIAILKKLDGPRRGLRDGDHVEIVVKPIADWNLAALKFQVTAQQLNQVLGAGSVDANGGTWWPEMGDVKVPGVFLPASPAEPIVPTDDELVAPTAVAPSPVSPTAQPAPAEGIGGGGEGGYVVQPGEWALKIARDHNVTLEQLQAVNPGTDLNNLQPGQILNLP